MLRRRLVERWHADIRAALDLDAVIATTEGHSFAEIEELKNLLILRHVDAGSWDWNWALKQFEINRHDLHRKKRRRVGFGEVEPLLAVNGHGR
jgi:hypothetical protein